MLVFARTRRSLLARMSVFLDELRQTLDQTPAAANHVQPALMLMLFQDVIDFRLELCHLNLHA